MSEIRRLSVSDLATIYGCCGLFDMCGDADLMSLSFQGMEPFLDWLGWEASLDCNLRRYFLTWIRPEQSGGSGTPGYLSDPCADPYSVEWGMCGFQLAEFGRLRRASPTRDVTMVPVRYCPTQPRYRLDGTPITDDLEFDVRLATEALLQDLKRLIITGNGAVGGQFDGLNQLVATGYTDPDGHACTAMDSIIIQWGAGLTDETDGTNQTWNGTAMAAGFRFFQVLEAVYRRIRQRISWAPALAAQRLSEGDIVLVMPTFMIPCFLDAYTCYRVCDGDSSVNVSVVINTYEARQFREGLLGGKFGNGQITLDGFPIPIIAYDWGLIQGPTSGDIYLLTGQVGNVKLLNGQYLNMAQVPVEVMGSEYAYTDGGRLLVWTEKDHTCVRRIVEMRPRLLAWAPWAQARFQDVVCRGPVGPMSPDPSETSFFYESSFVKAECP